MNQCIYTFENICLEVPELHLHDEAIKVFINTKGKEGNVTEEFRELLHFLDTSEIKPYANELVNDLADELEKARTNEKWERDFMTLKMALMEERREGRLRTLAELVKEKILTVAQAAEHADMTEAEFAEQAMDFLKNPAEQQTIAAEGIKNSTV